MLFLALPSSKASEEIPVDFEADRLDYYEEQGIIEGWGNVHLHHKGTNLKADYVRFNLNSRELFARGNVILYEKTKEVLAEELAYNISDGTATAQKVKCFEKPWHIKAEKLTRISPEEYVVERGEFK